MSVCVCVCLSVASDFTGLTWFYFAIKVPKDPGKGKTFTLPKIIAPRKNQHPKNLYFFYSLFLKSKLQGQIPPLPFGVPRDL